MKRQGAAIGVMLLSLGMLSLPGFAQQGKSKPLSPPAKTSCEFTGGKTITVEYSSPRMRGRKIYGGLVPFNEVWRLGANKATTLDTTTDLTIGGKDVPAGNYTLFAIPAPSHWTLIISKKTGEWGIPYPGESFDFARVPMTVSPLPSKLEDFTISLTPAGHVCTMHADWEMTRASIDIHEKP
ncbi:MAG: DUF2911 domain-containing protein [Acidobacteriota bacterium]|nr:DUF2911 domain-containing protein [Acidobacteriota bacterium]